MIYAHIRYYYHIPNPEDYEDEKVIMMFQDLKFIRALEKKNQITK